MAWLIGYRFARTTSSAKSFIRSCGREPVIVDFNQPLDETTICASADLLLRVFHAPPATLAKDFMVHACCAPKMERAFETKALGTEITGLQNYRASSSSRDYLDRADWISCYFTGSLQHTRSPASLRAE